VYSVSQGFEQLRFSRKLHKLGICNTGNFYS